MDSPYQARNTTRLTEDRKKGPGAILPVEAAGKKILKNRGYQEQIDDIDLWNLLSTARVESLWH